MEENGAPQNTASVSTSVLCLGLFRASLEMFALQGAVLTLGCLSVLLGVPGFPHALVPAFCFVHTPERTGSHLSLGERLPRRAR